MHYHRVGEIVSNGGHVAITIEVDEDHGKQSKRSERLMAAVRA